MPAPPQMVRPQLLPPQLPRQQLQPPQQEGLQNNPLIIVPAGQQELPGRLQELPGRQEEQQEIPHMLGLQNGLNPIFPIVFPPNRYGSAANLLRMKAAHRHPDVNARRTRFSSGKDARTWCALKKIYNRVAFYARRDGTTEEEAAETLDREREAAGESLSKFIKTLREMGYKKGTRNRNRN